MARDYVLTLSQAGDGTIAAMIECESFVAMNDGLDSVDEALEWARERTAIVSDPFVYED